jgi:hypothetical protein
MSALSFTSELTSDARILQLLKITKWAHGGSGATIPLCSENYENLTFSDLVEQANTAADAVADNSDSVALRTVAAYQLALARDMRYASAGRKRLNELAVHNAFRETYEGFKTAKDAEHFTS